MPSRPTSHRGDEGELQQLLQIALVQSNVTPLEHYLTEHSALPGPRMNTALLSTFAGLIGAIITKPDPPVERIEALLDGWAALPLDAAPVNDPREMLPAAAVRAYGQAAISRPDWWADEIEKLHRAAQAPRWRTREIVATAMQSMLAADWQRTFSVLLDWLSDPHPLVIRASAAAIAEPPLLTDVKRAQDALTIQKRAVEWLAKLPATRRREEDVRILRQALGFTVSVAIAAAPDAGFDWLYKLASSSDPDVQWLVRENLKKNRLTHWPDRVAEIQARLSS